MRSSGERAEGGKARESERWRKIPKVENGKSGDRETRQLLARPST